MFGPPSTPAWTVFYAGFFGCSLYVWFHCLQDLLSDSREIKTASLHSITSAAVPAAIKDFIEFAKAAKKRIGSPGERCNKRLFQSFTVLAWPRANTSIDHSTKMSYKKYVDIVFQASLVSHQWDNWMQWSLIVYCEALLWCTHFNLNCFLCHVCKPNILA